MRHASENKKSKKILKEAEQSGAEIYYEMVLQPSKAGTSGKRRRGTWRQPTIGEVIEAMNLRKMRPINLDLLDKAAESGNRNQPLEEHLIDFRARDWIEFRILTLGGLIDDFNDIEQVINSLQRMTNNPLTKREKIVVIARHTSSGGDEVKWEFIAKLLGVSRYMIWHIYKSAIAKLKKSYQKLTG